MTPKIATCCYCGTRAALVLSGRGRHELACSSCGAPLHDLKMLKAEHPGRSGLVKPSAVRKSAKYEAVEKPRKNKKGKRRKSLKRKIFEEAWDVLEDIFD
ncbi:MAG: hypothetical protein AAGK37_12260 [Pseudomonadota bacterium]